MPSAPKARRWCDVTSLRLPLLVLAGIALAVISGCQSSGEAGKPVAVLESAKKDTPPPPPPATPEPAAAEKPAAPAADPLLAAVNQIAAVQKKRGTLAALDFVFACYDRVKSPRVPLGEAQACAAQDFVVSKSVEECKAGRESPEKTKRAQLIAQRLAPRIGALMQLKGMNQNQFNTFGLWLHRVAKPAYDKAMAS